MKHSGWGTKVEVRKSERRDSGKKKEKGIERGRRKKKGLREEEERKRD